MDSYLTLKTVHIISAMLVFGTGIGIAWYQLRGWLTGDLHITRWISRETVTADWVFTASGLIVLLGSGLGMLMIVPNWLQQGWLQWALLLTGLVFLLWLPVVVLQYRLRLLSAQENTQAQQTQYKKIMRLWCALGAAAFPLMIAIIYLMVAKPAL